MFMLLLIILLLRLLIAKEMPYLGQLLGELDSKAQEKVLLLQHRLRQKQQVKQLKNSE
jgi:predicted Holliday junction resolvase-like endonuclease